MKSKEGFLYRNLNISVKTKYLPTSPDDEVLL